MQILSVVEFLGAAAIGAFVGFAVPTFGLYSPHPQTIILVFPTTSSTVIVPFEGESARGTQIDNQVDVQRLIARNRRLEALVDTLRRRSGAKVYSAQRRLQ